MAANGISVSSGVKENRRNNQQRENGAHGSVSVAASAAYHRHRCQLASAKEISKANNSILSIASAAAKYRRRGMAYGAVENENGRNGERRLARKARNMKIMALKWRSRKCNGGISKAWRPSM
jgi:hypothetical protein